MEQRCWWDSCDRPWWRGEEAGYHALLWIWVLLGWPSDVIDGSFVPFSGRPWRRGKERLQLPVLWICKLEVWRRRYSVLEERDLDGKLVVDTSRRAVVPVLLELFIDTLLR
jgi:hypothetical protein